MARHYCNDMGPYFRWAFVVICPCMRVRAEVQNDPSAYTFPSPCHPLDRAGTGAWRRAPLPTVIEGASHLRCLQGNHGDREGATKTWKQGVWEVCCLPEQPSLVLTMVKEVFGRGVSEGHRWGNIWDWGKKWRWGYVELVAVASDVFFFFFKPVLSSPESWDDEESWAPTSDWSI